MVPLTPARPQEAREVHARFKTIVVRSSVIYGLPGAAMVGVLRKTQRREEARVDEDHRR
jgi:hypothetical protein